jgi:rubredoxin
MTPVAARLFESLPRDNPCAQCGRSIAAPVWWEASHRGIAYDWVCEACDYEFTQIAMYHPDRMPIELDHAIAA